MERQIGTTRLVVVRGDITRQPVEAIVNAANSSLLGGGGVDGAIHRAGGPTILAACQEIVARAGRLCAGQAVVTPGGNLAARWVVHTVGPIFRDGGHGEAEILASCYRTSLTAAAAVGARTLCFPSIATGAYRYPIEEAARIAVATVVAELPHHPFTEVRFCLFSDRDLVTYEMALAEGA
ncbi:MAG: O-acetyl-ADP-ribose deacetylase [Nitrospirae bacterium CG18_big_fil_WC_8_21_14_2_50_70_55]|nr:O-acetyl-ADP-ribose deacetylase [Deltaproteobacteria bacterium]OIP62056.1 MAG: O-acetyl-ADP-ribose deacetylase [Nitrospirae bacterium CG2_30_70_394]PIQ05842.1 MAG: O-acetyl-ADP-ribose deacetylase [Nitrospirae bacterium CG18_big_fil_WC_8_21_14_2_50_70_55]PIU79616.1 MAG: O-acetyl-ADP-ribose deacetylase [Nitrospirae bacterium CG06_land_8_20_14_3_00_70_43]PIW82928.1 MAG: O-acetyl-ADP-ribose deacetylase [Nitrospirae bacterium CG_4_8_14_3_um_filter_70_85]PIX83809.1 MAG: O-acetyl-ADP-ribose deacet